MSDSQVLSVRRSVDFSFMCVNVLFALTTRSPTTAYSTISSEKQVSFFLSFNVVYFFIPRHHVILKKNKKQQLYDTKFRIF